MSATRPSPSPSTSSSSSPSPSTSAPKSKNAKTRERQKKKKQQMRSLIAQASSATDIDEKHSQTSIPTSTSTSTSTSTFTSTSSTPFVHEMKAQFTMGQKSDLDSRIATLMEEAEQLIIQSDAEQAITVLKQILTLSPGHTPALDLLAQALLDSGAQDGPEQAYKCLHQSCLWAPRDHPTKWMLLGQMQEGRAAVQSFNQGIKFMTEEIKMLQGKADSESEIASLRLAISSGYCSIAELYETDLCDEPEAESECERVLAAAVSVCPDNGEAYAALANLRMIQSQDEAALAALEQFINIYQNTQSDEERMQYEVRVNVSKMLLELNQHQVAVELLEDLLEEDDRFIEVHHLCAVCYYHLQRYRTAIEYTQQAITIFQKSGERNVQLKRTLETLLKNCQQGQAQQPEPEEEEEEEGEEDEKQDEAEDGDQDEDGEDDEMQDQDGDRHSNE